MRQVLHGDLIAAARSLAEIAPQDRAAAVCAMLYHAHSADKFRKRTGVPHRQWGNGSLMMAASPRPKQAEPSLSDLDYLASMQLILQELLEWKRSRRPQFGRHRV